MIEFESWYEPASLIKRLTDADNLLAGWQRVRDNYGCAGSDGVFIEDFAHALQRNLSLLAEEILRSAALISFGKEKRPKRINYMPPPLSITAYQARLYPR